MKMDLQNLFDWHICLRLLLAFFLLFYIYILLRKPTRCQPSKYISIWIWFPFPSAFAGLMFYRQQGLLITSRGSDCQLSLSGRLIELRKILLFSGCSDVQHKLSFPFDFPISQTNPPAHKNTITQQVDKLRTRGSTTTLNFSLRNVMPAFDILYTFLVSADRTNYLRSKSLILPSIRILGSWRSDFYTYFC